MDWYKHFPTLTPLYHRIAVWYDERDLIEKIGINIVAWCGVIWILFLNFFAPLPGVTTGVYIKIEEGMPLQEIAATLEERGVVRSGFLVKALGKVLGDERHIPAGEYYFSRRDNLVWVTLRIISGDFETSAVRITIPEGTSDDGISKILLQKLPEFNRRAFLDGAREGHMFPDTYFFRPGQSTEAVLSVFENNFRVQLLKAQKQITASGHTQEEILTMASLLEKEAPDLESRRMIAGILWHRIAIGMPLQVDAVFPYIIGKNTFELTRQDLQIDSPYNTYKYGGLPPGPITNPGLDSIIAAATPIKSSYIFYLSDKDGNFHYAVSYAQHMANRAKYIGN